MLDFWSNVVDKVIKSFQIYIHQVPIICIIEMDCRCYIDSNASGGCLGVFIEGLMGIKWTINDLL